MSISVNANRLLDAEDAGMLSWEAIARAAITYMSDDDLGDMIDSNELYVGDNIEDE